MIIDLVDSQRPDRAEVRHMGAVAGEQAVEFGVAVFARRDQDEDVP